MPANHCIIALSTFFITGIACYCSPVKPGNNSEPGYFPVAAHTGKSDHIIAGAQRFGLYSQLLNGKAVAVFANQTSMVGSTHLVDTLKSRGVLIKKIFSPEHGFRGTADAGEKVGNYTDTQTGIPVISLYGSKRKPAASDVRDVDVLVFDIQDVGVRFYTYISSLQEFMEAAIAFNKPLIILDRPNPNGFYVDGPVLDMQYKSFIGMQPIPVVYGMTIGEYAYMLLKENMLSVETKAQPVVHIDPKPGANISSSKFSLTIITCGNYTHNSKYILPVRPSPNLPDIQSVYLYPSTCFFEGTVLSEGRGTAKPFQVFGHPSLPRTLFSFTPNPTEGAKHSKLYGQLCYGWDLGGSKEEVLKEVDNKIQLKWLIEAYRLFPEKEKFFIVPGSGKMEASFFNKLAGNNELWQQIKNGVPEQDIRKNWEPGLSAFKKIRKKYLLYEDFSIAP
ncbi:DUF1343 domain-containing protein [Agriterribacter sp.]|uniref:exo-beta-N-acetylmuramidase NamZ family protein n=1 Tax=Agriterribacter sp. TaxID=2821509 RepID=UPI002C79A5C7|nr:DUF1343 domain-containing protein [Agriterribacter sp.]HTN08197.1 DUF1343 domain-containing protein [Agriterribacter sp.]